MSVEPIIQFITCFTNILEFTFIISDQISHISYMIINNGRSGWYYTIIRSMNNVLTTLSCGKNFS